MLPVLPINWNGRNTVYFIDRLIYLQMIKQKATYIFVKSNKFFNFGVSLKL